MKANDVRALTPDQLEEELAKLKKEQFNMDAEFTPSGVARITELQTREGFAYIKP